MAHTEQLGDITLEAIARQVENLYPNIVDDPNLLGQPAELAETFSIWWLRAEDILNEIDDITTNFQNTGRWHSQIRINGRANGVARSIPLSNEPTAWKVTQIFVGEIAELIDNAINWIDLNATGDPLVHILEIPAYHITAFWLIEQNSSILVVKMPRGMQFLEHSKIYTSKEFIQTLQKERFISGIK